MAVTKTTSGFPALRGDAALQLLTQQIEERITGVVGATFTLDNAPIPGTILLFKNLALLDPPPGGAGYSIEGRTVTLGVAAIAADVLLARYTFRSSSS